MTAKSAGDDQGDDRQDVAEVCSQRASHGTGAGLGGPWAAARPVEVGDGLVWQATSVLNGGVAPSDRAGADRRRRRAAAQNASSPGLPPGTGARRFGTGPPAGAGPPAGRTEIRAVAVEGAALAGEVGGRVEELLEVRHAGGEVVAGAGVVEHDVAGGQEHVVDAAAEQLDLGEESAARRPRPCAAPGPARRSWLATQPSSLLLQQRGGLVQPRAARPRSSPAARGCPGSARARRRAGTAGSRWCGAATARRSRSVGPSSLIVRSRLADSAASAPVEGVEVGDQALELRLVAGERAEDLGLTGDQAGEVVRLGAEQRLVDDRRVPGGRLRRSRRTC